MSNLVTRIITGVFFLLFVGGSILYSHEAFSALFLIVTILGIWEFYSLVETTGYKPNKIAGTIAGAYLFASNALLAQQYTGFQILLPNFLFWFVIFLLELYRPKDKPFSNLAFTFFGLLYIAVPFSLLNYLPNPAFLTGVSYDYQYLLGFFVMVWVNESGAYLVGVSIGRHRLFESVSPKKSWEGAIGGGLLTLATAWGISFLFSGLDLIDWLAIGAIVVVFGTYGDLFESLFKRSINAKDSGKILPGHGGILDRFDGVVMAAPFVFVYLLLVLN